MKKNFILLAMSFLMAISLSAQTNYNLSFETEGVDSDGPAGGNQTDQITVIIKASFDAVAGLGSANVRFDFDVTKLSNPTFLSTPLTSPDYNVTANSPSAGVASLNIVLNPFGGTPLSIDPANVDVEIGRIIFDVAAPFQDGTHTTDFTYRTDGTNPSTVVFTSSNNSMAPGVIMDAMGASLPIELSSFEVAKRGADAANLTWTTETEMNASHFEVEKSYTGSSFTYVGKVAAAGESASTQNYNLLDSGLELIPNQTTTIYYRLKMIDNDGSYDYSEVKSVDFGPRDVEVEVHPNPTADFVTIKSVAKITGITIVDIDGKIIRDNAQYNSKLDLTGLNSGMYKILVSTEDGEFVKSVIKID